LWYALLGAKKLDHAIKVWNIYIKNGADVATKNSQQEFISAMACLLMALKYAPDNLNVLSTIDRCSQTYPSIKWEKTVFDKIETFKHLQERKESEESLPKLRETSTKLNAELKKLKSDKGIFNGSKVREIEGKLRSIMAEIALKEKALAYEKPKVQFDW